MRNRIFFLFPKSALNLAGRVMRNKHKRWNGLVFIRNLYDLLVYVLQLVQYLQQLKTGMVLEYLITCTILNEHSKDVSISLTGICIPVNIEASPKQAIFS